jgi:pimeloyl-ACP methyl ester carboxylesterase
MRFMSPPVNDERHTDMTAQDVTRPRLTPARIVALTVIAVLAAGLVALRVSGGAASVTVPRGAHAGQLVLHPCTYPTDVGKLAADCGTLVVPENRQDPKSRLIALPVTRVHAATAHPGAPVLYLQGGPGLTNMEFPQASRFTATHDVLLVGYRGVDGSVRLDCPEVANALTGTSDLLANKTMRAYSSAFRHCAGRLTTSGIDLTGYNSVERVDDMEAARSAFGYRTVNLISESAGTRTAMVYSWRHPQSINRSVMIGVNPPGHYLYDGATTDAQIAHYSQLCAKDVGCRGETGNLKETMAGLAKDLPDRWLFLPIKPGNVKLGTFYGLAQATSAAAPLSSPQTINTWTSAAHGDSSGMWLLSLMAELTIPTSHVWGDMAATGQLDNDVAAAYYANGGDQGSILGNAFTDHLWGGGGLVQAWPHSPEVDQYKQLRPTDVDTLLINGDVDFATPAQVATTELLPTLRHGHEVVLSNLGHTADTWNYQKPAANRLINTFFDTGRVDKSGYTNRAMDFRASPTQTMLAKITLAALVGLGAVTALVLAWLPLRLRRRDSVGTKTSLAARTIYAPVVGLGGWCIGSLVVMTAWPFMSLDSQALAVVSIGGPVALATYFAWVHRSWQRSTRNAGLAVAVAGAVIGTWLGLHAVSGLFSVVTAVLAAVLGSNFGLCVRDITAPQVPPTDRPGSAGAPQQVTALT